MSLPQVQLLLEAAERKEKRTLCAMQVAVATAIGAAFSKSGGRELRKMQRQILTEDDG